MLKILFCQGRQTRNRSPCLGLLLMVGLLAAPLRLLAVQASPHPVQEFQPDGTPITLYTRGNREFHWYEDTQGYTVLRDRQRRYTYARLNAQQKLEATEFLVGRQAPEKLGLKKRILPSAAQIRQLRAESLGIPVASLGAVQAVNAAAGSVKNLVILVRFANHSGRTLPASGDIDVLFNAEGGDPVLAPTGSVRDVYLENSYNQLSLDSTIVGWLDVPNTEQYYANGVSGDSTLWQALTDALEQADASIDFNQFDEDNDGYIDAIAFLHSGYGAEWGGTDADGTAQDDRIWSHKWGIQPDWVSDEGVRVNAYHISPALWGTSGSNIGRIGVIAHETGHYFGLPDLYDTDQSSEGIGSWGIMANSWGFDGSQHYPPHFSPWSKIQLGWITPTTITGPGTYSLPEVESSPTAFRIDSGYAGGEYLLIENRQPVGFDGDMPQGGLAIWHIDDDVGSNKIEGYPGQSGWPENGNHYQVALLQADGDYDLERGINRGDAGDAFHGGGASTLGPNTVPSTDAYQDGIVFDTPHYITEISASGPNMSFSYSGPPPSVSYFQRAETLLSNWQDISDGNRHPLTDDGSTQVNIGFDFPFYGGTYSSLLISANGYLSFSGNGSAYNNTSLPNPASPNNLVAPFWDDLNPQSGGAIYSKLEGHAPQRRFTVSWQDLPHYSNIGAVSFQVTLLEESGDILFRYLDADFGNPAYDHGASATVGIEDASGNAHTQYAYNQAVLNAGDALRFSTRRDVLLVDDDDDSPDQLGVYTSALDTLGLLHSTWSTQLNGGGPMQATLDGYKSVIWFTGAKSVASGPDTTAETELAAWLDNGACLLLSSQDYHASRGLTGFMQEYLGVDTVSDDTAYSVVTGMDPLFTGLRLLDLSFPFPNYSDTLQPGLDTYIAFNGEQGAAGLARVQTEWQTMFWGFPFAAIASPDRVPVLQQWHAYCSARELDPDMDGLHSALELSLGTDPQLADSDGDGLDDGLELAYDGIPREFLAGQDLDPLDADSDNDGFNDGDELAYDGMAGVYSAGNDTDPLLADTDNDGFNDGVEINAGSNPLSDTDIPHYGNIDGDVNGDGEINTADVMLASRIVLGLRTPGPGEMLRGNVAPLLNGVPNPDADFNAADLLLIQRKMLGLVDF